MEFWSRRARIAAALYLFRLHAVTGQDALPLILMTPDDPPMTPGAQCSPVTATMPTRRNVSGRHPKEIAMFKQTLAMASVLGLALTVSQPALADTRVVNYGDLDLASKQGQAELNKRLAKAAKQVCGLDVADFRSPEFAAAQRCFHKSYAQAKQAQTGVIQMASAAAR